MNVKHIQLLAIAVALLAGVVLTGCRSHNYNGTWQGQTSEGKVISFTVNNNALTRAKLECKLQCQLSGFCPTESSFEGDVTATLDGNSFSASVGDATFTGKFDSDSTSSGELKVNTSSPQCGECKSTATWTAKKL
ncbi:MAG: hypothetical protein ABI596_01725 [Pyrinomonadaceae bacterium]